MSILENDQGYKLSCEELESSVYSFAVSPNCSRIAQSKEHVLIGISPFNSYYSEQRITKLIQWGATNFKDFHLFVPDTLPYFNFLAMGYAPDKAKNKTTRQWNYLRNKIHRAFSNNNIPMQEALKVVTIGKTLVKNNVYIKLCEACLNKYKSDFSFKEACLNATKVVLSNYTKLINDDRLEVAVQYLLAELPLYLNTPAILNVKSSLFVYHEKLSFFEELYNLRNNELLADNQGHIIVKV